MSDGRSSPLEIEMILHFHCFPGPWPNPSSSSVEIIRQFLKDGILEGNEDDFKVSLKGVAWVNMLCGTPYPRLVLIDPRTGQQVKDPFAKTFMETLAEPDLKK